MHENLSLVHLNTVKYRLVWRSRVVVVSTSSLHLRTSVIRGFALLFIGLRFHYIESSRFAPAQKLYLHWTLITYSSTAFRARCIVLLFYLLFSRPIKWDVKNRCRSSHWSKVFPWRRRFTAQCLWNRGYQTKCWGYPCDGLASQPRENYIDCDNYFKVQKPGLCNDRVGRHLS